MKRIGILLLTAMLSVGMLSACSGSGRTNNSGSTGNVSSGDVSEEEIAQGQIEDEDETAEIETQKVDDSFFVGTWVANTDKAKYMYGNVKITINEDGTWEGNITDEDIQGEWKRSGDGIKLTSDVIPFNMIYSSNNNVLLQETDDAVRVVLTRQ